MIALQRQSIRSLIRVVTLMAALASLVLAMLTSTASPALATTEHCPGLPQTGSPDMPPEYEGWVPAVTNVDTNFGDTLTLPPGTVFCVKASTSASGILVMGETGTWSTPDEWNPGRGGPGISYYVIYTPPQHGSGTVQKVWTGDEFDDSGVTVEFTATIDDGEPFTMEPGDTVILEFDQTLTITDESVTGLPPRCTYVSDLDEIDASFTASETTPNGTITITNDVTCETGGGGSGTVAKAWTGDTFDHTGVTVTFTATIGEGAPFTMTPDQTVALAFGETLTITSEAVTGLPARCDYVSNLPQGGASFTATQEVPNGTITVINDVTCTPPPPPPPGGSGSGSVAKAWAGDTVSLDGVSVTFTANVNGGSSFTMAPGDSRVLQFGQTLTITDEDVTGLPTTCTYVSDLPEGGASFTATRSDPTGTITVTNTIDCTEVTGTATVAKAWTGDTFDDTGVTVEFTATVNDGAPFTMAPDDSQVLALGDTLTITGEDVTGLASTCSYVSDLPAGGASFTATEADPDGTITITNDVTCTEVNPNVVVNVRLEKVWDLNGPPAVVGTIDTDAMGVTFTLDGSTGTYEPGDTVTAEPGDVLVAHETMTGALPKACELTDTIADPYTVTDASGQVLTITNVVECAAVKPAVIERDELPATGADTGMWALVAALLSSAGALLLLATRETPTGRRG